LHVHYFCHNGILGEGVNFNNGTAFSKTHRQRSRLAAARQNRKFSGRTKLQIQFYFICEIGAIGNIENLHSIIGSAIPMFYLS
jgi:hypothetical protein